MRLHRGELQLDAPCGQLAKTLEFQFQTLEIKQEQQIQEEELILIPNMRKLIMRL